MPEYGKKQFMANMLIMTSAMLLIRIVGMAFNIYFTSVIGPRATGMYHLIFSVYGFMITFSVAGTGIAVTRLASENGDGGRAVLETIIRKCMTICLVMSAAAGGGVIFFKDFISRAMFDDSAGAPALVLLAASLPAVAASNVFRGYFMAMRKVSTATLSQLIEEMSSVAITFFMLRVLKNSPYAYMSMIVGVSCSAAAASFFDFVMYRAFMSATRGSNQFAPVGYRSILRISVPIALGSYLRSMLVSAENILIPKRLALSGMTDALGEYGIIKGMSMPLMMFPMVFVGSFASMLVPELAMRKAKSMPNGIRYIADKAVKYILYFAFMAASLLFMCHAALGEAFYHSDKVSAYLGALSLLVIPMYLDTVVDSMLKGLNEQMSSLRYNIADSCIRVALIWTIIPVYGVAAYIFILYASEIFNLTLSIRRLSKASGLKINAKFFVYPAVFCTVSAAASSVFGFPPAVRSGVFIAICCTMIFVYEKFTKSGKSMEKPKKMMYNKKLY